MSEKKIKPTIEEFAANLLDGDNLKNFLEFNALLKNNKLTKGSTGTNGWVVRYKIKNICHFRIYKDYWLVYYYKDKELLEKCEKYITDELKEFILSNVNTVPGCGKCKGIENIVIFGKTFDRVCGCQLLLLNNPDGKAFEYAKELVLINKKIVDDIVAVKA